MSNQLLSIRSNFTYAKIKEGEYRRFREIVLLTDTTDYRRSSEGEVVRERGVGVARFVVSDEALQNLIRVLTEMLNEEDAGASTNNVDTP